MLVIAEIGSNWKSLDTILRSIDMAKLCGADAVKLQLYDHQKLYGYRRRMAGCLEPHHVQHASERARENGLKFILSVFDPNDVWEVRSHVDYIKIASSNSSDVLLLQSAAECDRPIILSTGASSISDIRRSLGTISSIRNDDMDTTLMYCVSSYPSVENDLSVISLLRIEFGLPVGLSDHSLDVFNSPVIAKDVYGCSMIEKHFKISNMGTPDSGHSLGMHDFERMTRRLASGMPREMPKCEGEEHMLLKNKVRLVAIDSIDPGDTFSYGKNFGIFRSKEPCEDPMSPYEWMSVDNAKCCGFLSIGDSIRRVHVEGLKD